jgi:molybdopterin/thiamine biosynthesis adenylyltransferase
MPIDTTRIASAIDVATLSQKIIAVIGTGASVGMLCDLARCGLGEFKLVDRDLVEPVNMARQAHHRNHVGRPKVDAAAAQLRRLNPDMRVVSHSIDFLAPTDEELQAMFADVDLFLFCTDSFACQARGNQLALRSGTPAVFVGLYPGAGAGEIVWWQPGLPCFRCLVPGRYAAQIQARTEGRPLDPSSTGATILDIHLLDAIAGQIAIGLLTQGADNRFGRLIAQLGDRNMIQLKIDPEWNYRGRDVFREQLQVPDGVDTMFAWTAIARRDPDGGRLYCPDCAQLLGRTSDAAPAGK